VILPDINVEGSENDKNCNQNSLYSNKGPNSGPLNKRTGKGVYSQVNVKFETCLIDALNVPNVFIPDFFKLI
jgi:hypothetical protein